MGFGCWEMGGPGYGSTDEAEVARAVHRAIHLGVTLFDTAPVYGFGQSEEALGRARPALPVCNRPVSRRASAAAGVPPGHLAACHYADELTLQGVPE